MWRNVLFLSVWASIQTICMTCGDVFQCLNGRYSTRLGYTRVTSRLKDNHSCNVKLKYFKLLENNYIVVRDDMLFVMEYR